MQKQSLFALVGAVLAISAPLLAQDYQVISVADGGTIRGTVKWSGLMPRLATAAITKDPKICDPNSEKSVSLERLIVGPEDGVANTVVYLKNITRGKELDRKSV